MASRKSSAVAVVEKRVPVKSTLIKQHAKHRLSGEVIDELVSYEYEPEDTQKALAAAAYLLDWTAHRMENGQEVSGTLVAGLGQLVRHFSKEVGELYSYEDVVRLGGEIR